MLYYYCTATVLLLYLLLLHWFKAHSDISGTTSHQAGARFPQLLCKLFLRLKLLLAYQVILTSYIMLWRLRTNPGWPAQKLQAVLLQGLSDLVNLLICQSKLFLRGMRPFRQNVN